MANKAALDERIVVVDLQKDYDRALLNDYFNNILKPNFGMFDDELDPIETWVEAMEHPEENDYTLHILLAFDKSDRGRKKILGSAACEYYPMSSVGLLTYFAVIPEERKKGLGRHLIDSAHKTMQREARKQGRGTLKAFLLETNNDAKVSASKDIMDPKLRHRILNNIGFVPLGFDYVQPALSRSKSKCADLLLCCHKQYITEHGVPKEPIAEWITEFFRVLMGKRSMHDPDHVKIMEKLANTTHIDVLGPEGEATAAKRKAAQAAQRAADESAGAAARAKAEQEAAAKKKQADIDAAAAAAAAKKRADDAAATRKQADEAAAKKAEEATKNAVQETESAKARSAPVMGIEDDLSASTKHRIDEKASVLKSTTDEQKKQELSSAKVDWKKWRLPEGEAAEAYFMFHKFDKDKSGTLSLDEVIEITSVLMGNKMKPNLVKRLASTYFNASDSDKSGAVGLDEFIHIYSSVKANAK